MGAGRRTAPLASFVARRQATHLRTKQLRWCANPFSHRRRGLLRATVAMFFVPLFVVGPESVEQWWAQHLCRAAYGACDPQTPSLDTLTYECDGNGNLTRTRLNGTAQAEYVYDAENRLVACDPTPGAVGAASGREREGNAVGQAMVDDAAVCNPAGSQARHRAAWCGPRKWCVRTARANDGML
jgi:YD repeat-containing protein